MRRAIVVLAACMALGACRAPQKVQAVEEATTAARRVEVLRCDSSQAWLIVELDEPRLSLRRDSAVELRASAARVAARVSRSTAAAASMQDSTARQAVVAVATPAEPARGSRRRWWLWALAGAGAVIALSWRGIRLRR